MKHNRSSYKSRLNRTAGASGRSRSGQKVRGETAKKDHFTGPEQSLLRNIGIVKESVFSMKKPELKMALEKLSKLTRSNIRQGTHYQARNLIGKIINQMEKLKADEAKQKRN